jgi:hypothetical protein
MKGVLLFLENGINEKSGEGWSLPDFSCPQIIYSSGITLINTARTMRRY